MTDEEKIALIRLLIGDVPTSPFYQLFTDSDLQKLLDFNGGDVRVTARMAAISASMQLAGWNTRERTGDLEVWNSLSSNYLKNLENIINNPIADIPNGLMPWAGGISWTDVCENNRNPDNVRSPLTQIKTCESNLFNCSSCGCSADCLCEVIII